MRDLAITAIIPLYNGAEFIKEAVESVLAQILPAETIMVVNDGSTDNGPDIVAALAREHPDILLLHKANGGQSSARNLGIAQAETPLIALLDQDDIWYPHHLRELVKPFRDEHHPPLGWVYSNLDEIDRNGAMVTRSCIHQTGTEHPKRSLRGCLERDMFVVPTATLVSRAAVLAVGGFDETLIGYEDDDLFLRLFRHGYENVWLDEALAKWRIFPGSTSWSPKMRRSRMIYMRKLMETFPPGEPPGDAYWRTLLGPRFFPMLVMEYLRAARTGSPEAIRDTAGDLAFLLPYLPRRTRLGLMAALPAMRHGAGGRLLARLVDLEPPFLRRAYRHLSGGV